jgi:hypothetical protein
VGITTKAILAYGFSLCDEGEDIPPLLHDKLVNLLILNTSEDDEPIREGDDVSFEENWYDLNDYYLREKDIELIEHCHPNSPMFFVSIKGTETVSYRGDVTDISELVTPPGANEQLTKFCQEFGIPIRDFGWCLMAYCEH